MKNVLFLNDIGWIFFFILCDLQGPNNYHKSDLRTQNISTIPNKYNLVRISMPLISETQFPSKLLNFNRTNLKYFLQRKRKKKFLGLLNTQFSKLTPI